MPQPTDYAVLFSGGSNQSSNHSRYYLSLKKNYELLLERGVPAENIIIAFAEGVKDPKVGLSKVFDTHVQLDEYDFFIETGINDFTRDFNISNNINFEDKFNNLFRILSSPENGESLASGGDRPSSNGRSTSYAYYSFDNEQSADAFRQSVDAAASKVNNLASQSNIVVNTKFSKDAKIPSRYILDIDAYSKSDFSFATDKKTTVIEATKDALQTAVGGLNNSSKDTLYEKIGKNDSLYVWTFDHGSHPHAGAEALVSKEFEGVNSASLVTWDSTAITSQEFANIFRGVTENAGMSTYAFAQCFAGGLLEALSIDPLLANSNKWFGMSATNQYEVSNASYFAEGIAKGLKDGADTGNELFSVASNSYEQAKVSAVPNSWVDNTGKSQEHPWSHGYDNSGERPIFVNDVALDGRDSQGLRLFDRTSLEIYGSFFASQSTYFIDLTISEDQPLDLFDQLQDQFGDLSDFRFEGYDPSDSGILDYDKDSSSLIYTPLKDFSGQDDILLRFSSKGFFYDLDVDISVESVNDAPIAVDDFVQISSGDSDVLINVNDQPGFLDDTDVDGDALSIASYSAPANGTIEQVGDFLFEYQPNAGFVGSDSFLYVLSDGVAFDVAEVLIDVVDPTLSL